MVIDASAMVEYLLRTPLGLQAGEVIEETGVHLHVPALCDVEVAAAARRLLLRRLITRRRVQQMIEDYTDLWLDRHGHLLLLGRIIDLRSNFSAYDAAYVALAEELGAHLLTGDKRLATSLRKHTSVAVAM